MHKQRGQGVTHVSNLFSKYITLLKPPQGVVVQASIDVINEMFHYTIQKKQCTYHTHSKTLSLTIPGALKTEVLLRKNEVLTEIGKKIGIENTPKNIL